MLLRVRIREYYGRAASRIACHTRSGVAGIEKYCTPSGRSASSKALITVGGARFERIRRDAIALKAKKHYVIGQSKRGIGCRLIAEYHLAAFVAVAIIVDL